MMAITNFIPQLWSAAMLELWVAQNVFPSLVNREYEGIATKGNQVHITGVVIPTVHDYNAAGKQTTPQAITDTGIDLLINQAKSTDFLVDDVDRAQAAGTLTPYTDAAAYAMVADTDLFIANMLIAGGTSLTTEVSDTFATSGPNYGGTLTGDDAFNLLKDARKQLNKANVPPDNRVVVVNAEFEGLLLGANSKLTTFYMSNDTAGLRNATIGQILAMRVCVSNHMTAINEPQFVAFNMRAAAFVSQVDQVEAMRDVNSFSDRVRALHVYGGLVVRPTGVVVYNQGGS
jgi:P22 coat protein - gene protein 5